MLACNALRFSEVWWSFWHVREHFLQLIRNWRKFILGNGLKNIFGPLTAHRYDYLCINNRYYRFLIFAQRLFILKLLYLVLWSAFDCLIVNEQFCPSFHKKRKIKKKTKRNEKFYKVILSVEHIFPRRRTAFLHLFCTRLYVVLSIVCNVYFSLKGSFLWLWKTHRSNTISNFIFCNFFFIEQWKRRKLPIYCINLLSVYTSPHLEWSFSW